MVWSAPLSRAGDLNSGVSHSSLRLQPLSDTTSAPTLGFSPSRYISFKGPSFILSTLLDPAMGDYQGPSSDQDDPAPCSRKSQCRGGDKLTPRQQQYRVSRAGMGKPRRVLDLTQGSGSASWRRRHHSLGRKRLVQAQGKYSRQNEQSVQSPRIEKRLKGSQAQI